MFSHPEAVTQPSIKAVHFVVSLFPQQLICPGWTTMLFFLSIATLSLLATQAVAQDRTIYSTGSFSSTCINIQLSGSILTATCDDLQGGTANVALNIDSCVSNVHGQLQCDPNHAKCVEYRYSWIAYWWDSLVLFQVHVLDAAFKDPLWPANVTIQDSLQLIWVSFCFVRRWSFWISLRRLRHKLKRSLELHILAEWSAQPIN